MAAEERVPTLQDEWHEVGKTARNLCAVDSVFAKQLGNPVGTGH
jgi:hypothetical protein